MSDADERFDELAELWRSRPVDDGPFDHEEVLMDVKRRAKRFDRAIFWRDVREIGAGVVVLVGMGGASLLAPGWLPKLGGVAIAIAVTVVVARLLAARRAAPDPRTDLPLAGRVRGEIDKVEAQARLLRSVRSWYVMPIAVGGIVWLATMTPVGELPTGLAAAAVVAMIGAGLAIFIPVGAFVERLNRIALERQIDPYLADLRGTLEQLEADG